MGVEKIPGVEADRGDQLAGAQICAIPVGEPDGPELDDQGPDDQEPEDQEPDDQVSDGPELDAAQDVEPFPTDVWRGMAVCFLGGWAVQTDLWGKTRTKKQGPPKVGSMS